MGHLHCTVRMLRALHNHLVNTNCQTLVFPAVQHFWVKACCFPMLLCCLLSLGVHRLCKLICLKPTDVSGLCTVDHSLNLVCCWCWLLCLANQKVGQSVPAALLFILVNGESGMVFHCNRRSASVQPYSRTAYIGRECVRGVQPYSLYWT